LKFDSKAEIKRVIADDGLGLPQGPGAASASNLGLRLVRTLAQQIRARVEIVDAPQGATFLTIVPLQPPVPAVQ
jgi:two-component sensor histidine kinase